QMLPKITALRRISALHVCERIAGLRLSGKGANRTILDWLFLPWGAEKAVFLPPRGTRAPAACLRGSGVPHVDDPFRRFCRLQLGKGLGS
ncbi:hypothetical protein ABTF02_18190, partial [Acinetobacter baumannii]